MRYFSETILSRLLEFSLSGKVDIFCSKGELCTKQRWTKYIQNEYIRGVTKSFIDIAPLIGPPQRIETHIVHWIVSHKSPESNETDLEKRIWLKGGNQ